ncbi:HD domain-containing phosphohydrolase [Inconstantimicrobium mannanitabidum]|uniref:Diguanylate cyclase n=1 Tax=Inconstantimicrobium mannanitabidum TaxID=1604901 RepID=A0ACB5RFP9_9CLOT|nr:HD domain-containing phosphohydrolase [Clostridium sp. TW13]GKX67921.1 diguanylate cyclase [Clostridium sp. TW13]
MKIIKIKYKAIVITVLSVIPLIGVTDIIFEHSYSGYVNNRKLEETKKSFDAVSDVITKEQNSVTRTVEDWAKWTDTYEFITNSDKKYIASNLQDDTLKNLDLQAMIFINKSGKIVYAKEDKEKKISKDIINSVHIENIKKNRVGLMVQNGNLYVVGISTVTPSDNQNISNGFLIIIKHLDISTFNILKRLVNVEADIEEASKFNISSYDKLVENIRYKQDKESIEAVKVLKNINGDDVIAVKLINFGDKKAVNEYFILFNIHFIILLIAIIAIDFIVLNKYSLKRLKKLNDFIEEIIVSKDITRTISLPGKDEYAMFAALTNRMLKELNLAYKGMREQNERFMMLMEATNDGVLDYSVKEDRVYISNELKQLIGFNSEKNYVSEREYVSRVHLECAERLREHYHNIINGNSEYFNAEYRMIDQLGNITWVLHRGKIVGKDENGKPLRIISTLVNITDRKKYEEETLFLSYSDKLTGLRNRSYMEKQFQALDSSPKSQYYIVMCDVNGLKVVNDTFGHKEGDHLLCTIANILTESCEQDDIISRLGGDEFIILIEDKDEEYVKNLQDKIKIKCDSLFGYKYKVSMAIGYASKTEEISETELVMGLADLRMYRNKLTEEESTRSATIESLLNTLHEKHSETEEHTVRIKELSIQLGEKLGLNQEKLDELKLLSLLHDIGKVGIPENILMKPGKLTVEEWAIMKTHTQIGYRIAKSSSDFSHIANEILAHHERYDGTGYPNGLKGEEIPLLSRIINVVDSFDVMTNKRAYKEAFNLEYAFKELNECSGTQFDPYIVKEFIDILQENIR